MTATTTRNRARNSDRPTPEQILERIQSGQFGTNDIFVIQQFADAGIDPDQIEPRQNVLTFNAWKALGRRVAKGAISRRITTWIECGKSTETDAAASGETKAKKFMRPKDACVFHVSQTVPADAGPDARPDAWNNPALIREGTYTDQKAGEDAETADTAAAAS